MPYLSTVSLVSQPISQSIQLGAEREIEKRERARYVPAVKGSCKTSGRISRSFVGPVVVVVVAVVAVAAVAAVS